MARKYDTHFIEKNNDLLFSKQEFDKNCEDMAIITAFFDYTSNIKDIEVNTKIQPLISKWKDSGRIKGTMRY